MLLNEIVVDSLTLNLLKPVYIVRKKMTRIRYEHLDAATGPSSCQQMLNLIDESRSRNTLHSCI